MDVLFCRKIRAVHKHNTSDVKEFGPDSGVGVLDALDVYIAAEVSKIPSMYFNTFLTSLLGEFIAILRDTRSY